MFYITKLSINKIKKTTKNIVCLIYKSKIIKQNNKYMNIYCLFYKHKIFIRHTRKKECYQDRKLFSFPSFLPHNNNKKYLLFHMWHYLTISTYVVLFYSYYIWGIILHFICKRHYLTVSTYVVLFYSYYIWDIILQFPHMYCFTVTIYEALYYKFYIRGIILQFIYKRHYLTNYTYVELFYSYLCLNNNNYNNLLLFTIFKN